MARNIALFLLLKLILLLILAVSASYFIPYLGHFSFPDILTKYGVPNFIASLANFDGIHYIKIVRENYYPGGWAFFPLYPLLIKVLSPFFFGNHILAAIIISNISFMVGCIYLAFLLKDLKISRLWFFIFLFAFPTAFFFQIAYTEGLFFMLTVLTLYYLRQRNFWAAACFAILSSATRLIGVFLFIPVLMMTVPKGRKLSLLTAFAPFLGIGGYMVYQWLAAGDPLAFVHAQPGFGAARSLSFILLPQVYFRYAKILFTTRLDFGYFISLLEIMLFTFTLVTAFLDSLNRYKNKQNFLLSIGLFSLVSMIFPTLTGTLLSTPRFALMSLSSFFFLAGLKNTYLKVGLASVFVVLQIVLFAFFTRGYFVA